MSREGVQQLIDYWINDPGFRVQLRQDPEGTVRRSGADLNEEEWTAVRSLDWSLSDEELLARVSKSAFT
jgi:hypothetical protein